MQLRQVTAKTAISSKNISTSYMLFSDNVSWT